MKVIRAFFGIVVLAIAASLPWIVQDHMQQNGTSVSASSHDATASVRRTSPIGSKTLAAVRDWFSTDSSPAARSSFSTAPSDSPAAILVGKGLATSARAKTAATRVAPILNPELRALGLKMGDPVFVRIFKEEAELEVWMLGDGKTEYELFKTFEICAFSGKPGPKLKEGDRQAPEGFYYVPPSRMNPNSQFHLSFDLGFPNEYDTYHGRMGTFLMVHGNCVSAGCYAMTDIRMEEIYTLVAAALGDGQKYFRVHAFPFRMTDSRMNQEFKKKGKWLEFWGNLKEGYDYFEMMKLPPNTSVKDGKYAFGS